MTPRRRRPMWPMKSFSTIGSIRSRRSCVRKCAGFIETMIEEELEVALARPRYGRRPVEDGAAVPIAGHRHGRRIRSLTGTFGPTEITVPRARIFGADGKTAEWKSKVVRSHQRRTRAADALIAPEPTRAGSAGRWRPCL